MSAVYFITCVVLCWLNFASGQDDQTLPGFMSQIWPGGIVPYIVDETFQPFEKKRIQDSIGALNNDWFCVKFRQRADGDFNYLSFIRTDDRCQSQWIGYAGNGPQPIYLSSNCSTPRYIYWVLLQALGLPAEHQRPDRDEFITIKWENIQEAYKDAFKRYEYIDQKILDVPYDIFSRLHYPVDRFPVSPGLKTMVANADPTMELGNPLSPTVNDYRKLAALYCPGGTPGFPDDYVPTVTPFPEDQGSGQGNNGSPDVEPGNSAEVPLPPSDWWQEDPLPSTTQSQDSNSEPSPTFSPEAQNVPLNPSSSAGDRPTRPPKVSPPRYPTGIPAYLVRQLAQAPPTETAQQYCQCLDKPNAKGSCDGPFSFQWRNMAENCLQNSSNPVCQCERISTNPCWCEVSGNTCVKRCRQPASSLNVATMRTRPATTTRRTTTRRTTSTSVTVIGGLRRTTTRRRAA